MTADITLKRFGLTAILVECHDLDEALAVHAWLQQNPPTGALEFIPAAQTVLVRFDSEQSAVTFARCFTGDGTFDTKTANHREHLIEVVYDGEDLGDVARYTGLSIEGVIAAHVGQQWAVAFAGFAPGFFYLHSDKNKLEVPRRSSPRTAVPTGAVGLAGQFSGIYPRVSPGGWQLIGRTTAPLWDLNQNPPALLEPGDTVRFKAVREHIVAAPMTESETEQSADRQAFAVKMVGAQLLFQDEGRRGLTDWGVSPAGFADPVSAHAANLLVGNDNSATVLESLLGGFVLEALEDSVIALTGARVLAIITEPEKNDRVVPLDTPVAVLTGQTLRVGIAEAGLRVYLAVRGGFSVPNAVQSHSSDTMSGIGPAPVATGDKLVVAEKIGTAVAYPVVAPSLPRNDAPTEVRVVFGPREDWFTADSLKRFCTTAWKVTPQSNRIGVRLAPATEHVNLDQKNTEHKVENSTQILERSNSAELPSEGMISGAIQVPPNGEPVVFLSDHPVTGGYPVIACVHPGDLRLLAQSQPGTTIRFTRFETSFEANEQESPPCVKY